MKLTALFPAAFFQRIRGSDKKICSQISKNKLFFFIANERDLIHQYRRRRLQKKPLQCKKFFKIKQNRPESLAQKNEKRKFSFYLNKK